MDIASRLDFAARPSDVFAMLTDRDYLAEVCVACSSRTYDVAVNGVTTHTSRTFDAPDAVARFTGSQLSVVEDTVWSPAGAEDARTGTLTMNVTGQPVSLKGQIRIQPGGRGTLVDLTGDLKVAIPLLGRKLEQSTAPTVLAGFETQQSVGDRWLSR
ncbi:MAG: hypothetical protein JWP61_2626 [Friedmanniella sp.]|jgi:hypothetical protein|nr:hypothetical protein [Friedmanniella sp.]